MEDNKEGPQGVMHEQGESEMSALTTADHARIAMRNKLAEIKLRDQQEKEKNRANKPKIYTKPDSPRPKMLTRDNTPPVAPLNTQTMWHRAIEIQNQEVDEAERCMSEASVASYASVASTAIPLEQTNSPTRIQEMAYQRTSHPKCKLELKDGIVQLIMEQSVVIKGVFTYDLDTGIIVRSAIREEDLLIVPSPDVMKNYGLGFEGEMRMPRQGREIHIFLYNKGLTPVHMKKGTCVAWIINLDTKSMKLWEYRD
jgi:hypothetical protein